MINAQHIVDFSGSGGECSVERPFETRGEYYEGGSAESRATLQTLFI
jgi:hypothetical protein